MPYYRARYYDFGVGRFLSEDASRFRAGVNFYAYVENNPIDLTDPAGLCPPERNKKPCRLTLNLTYMLAVSSVVQQNVVSTLGNLFGPDIALDVSTSNPKADLNIYVAPVLPSAGELGHVPLLPNGNPANTGAVDLGLIMLWQSFHHAGNAALGSAIAQVMAHELGHELFLPHSSTGGIMSPAMDPFVPNTFKDTDLINILSRCLFLRGKGAK